LTINNFAIAGYRYTFFQFPECVIIHTRVKDYNSKAAKKPLKTISKLNRTGCELNKYGLVFCATTLMAFAFFHTAVTAAQPAWKPVRNVEIIVGVSPGGGVDRTARTLQKILQDRRWLEVNSSVLNKPGGGGILAQTYLNQHAGDAHYLEVSATSLLTNHITGKTPNAWYDFTPIAMLYDEFIGFAVKADSPLKSGRELADLLSRDPAALPVGIATSAGNTNHIALALLMKRAGGDVKKLKVVVFGSGGESTTALLGGHVALVTTPAATALPHMQSGAVRMLAVAAPKRLEGALAQVPTWRELGYDIVVSNWRPIMGPRGLSAEQIAYWADIIHRFTQTREWQDELAATGGLSHYMGSRELAAFLETQSAAFRGILSELGLAR
jgi:putative tricarboxylic transport membrane protein